MSKSNGKNVGRIGGTEVIELGEPPETAKENILLPASLAAEVLLDEYDHEAGGVGSSYRDSNPSLRDEVLRRLRNATESLTNGSGAAPVMDGGLDPRTLARKRWGVDWHEVPLHEGNGLLGDLKEEFERAAKIMQQRQKAAVEVECACGCGRRLQPGLACMSRTLRDEKTTLPYNVYFATQECVRQQNKKQYGLAEMIK